MWELRRQTVVVSWCRVEWLEWLPGWLVQPVGVAVTASELTTDILTSHAVRIVLSV